MSRRVVVTGMGAITPIGNSVDEMFKSIENDTCGIDYITAFDTSEYKVKLAGEVKDLDMDMYFSPRELKFNDRFTQFARIAAKQAMLDASFDENDINHERFGVIFSSGIGGLQTIEKAQDVLSEKGPRRISPYFIPMSLVNMAAGQIAIDWKAQGVCETIVTACAAGTCAIGEAFHKIRDGYEDIIICGSSEAAISPLGIAGFMSMRALHEGEDKSRASIPFDASRSGFVMGEGAGALVLEELEHALARKATIYGEIIGYGATCDACHITAPDNDAKMGSMAMIKAINDANINLKDIEYINAHGTSTPLNDKTETLAIKNVFGKDNNVLVSSTKSHMGHLLGASGSIEAIITLKALQTGIIPANLGYENADEECNLNIVANNSIHKDIELAMSNSLGFGGHNASLVMRKWEE